MWNDSGLVARTDEMADIAQIARASGNFSPSLFKEIDMSFNTQIACLEEEIVRVSGEAEEAKRHLSAEST